jgi:hypothetical protein
MCPSLMSLATPFRELALEISAASVGSSQTIAHERRRQEGTGISSNDRKTRMTRKRSEEDDVYILFLCPTLETEAASRVWTLRLESLATVRGGGEGDKGRKKGKGVRNRLDRRDEMGRRLKCGESGLLKRDRLI